VNAHLQAQHLFEAGIPLFFFDELAPVRLGDTFPHNGTKAVVPLTQTQCGFFHQTLGSVAAVAAICSCASGSGAKYISMAFRLRKTSRAATLIHCYYYHDNNIEVGSGRP
jgi:hypothetical protein